MSTRSLLLAAAVLAAPALAPSVQAQASFGLRAGLNVADLTGDNLPGTKPRLGFTGGAFANLPVGASGLSFQPEVSYSQKGVSSDNSGTEYRVDYVEVPILVRYDVPVTDSGLMLGAYAGPAIGFKVSEEVSGNLGSVNTDLFKSTDVGAAFGVGVGAGPFGVDGRYTLGLSRATDDGSGFDVKNGVFSVAATYSFGGRRMARRPGRRY